MNPEFAFLVVKQADGRYAVAVSEEVKASRQPTLDDIYGAIKVIEKDMMVQQTVAMLQPQPEPHVTSVAPSQKFTKIKREEKVG